MLCHCYACCCHTVLHKPWELEHSKWNVHQEYGSAHRFSVGGGKRMKCESRKLNITCTYRGKWGYFEIVFDCNGIQHAHILTHLHNSLTNPIIIHTWILQILILHIFGLAHHERLSSEADSRSTHTVPQRLWLLLFACIVCEATLLVIMLIIIQCILDELCASIFAQK